jgi:hypothetical protein
MKSLRKGRDFDQLSASKAGLGVQLGGVQRPASIETTFNARNTIANKPNLYKQNSTCSTFRVSSYIFHHGASHPRLSFRRQSAPTIAIDNRTGKMADDQKISKYVGKM